MIRLLSVQPVAERGGSDQALLRMIRSLPSDEFRCHLALPGPSPLADEYAAAGATLHTVPMQRISTSHRVRDWLGYVLGWPLAVGRLVRLIRNEHIDVVHTNSLHSWYGWAAAFVTRRPHVWHAREINVQSRLALRVERFLTRRFATRVIAMSQAIADQLDPANVVVVYETADAREFHAGRAGAFRPRIGIADDALLVGTIGRIDTWKGFDVMLDAFELVTVKRPDIHLVVAGGAVKGKEALAEELAARAATIDHVHWLGPRTDAADLLADLDLFALPSTEPEPYGLVVVEALASGVPVVVTDAGGPPEIVARAADGAGRLVAPGSPDALAGAIDAVLAAGSVTSTAVRSARLPLRAPEPEQFAAIFRDAAATKRGRG
jgi:glycosyltransferase involved in cell wall biosynthesis